MHAVTIATPGLGDRSYVVIHEGTAVVVDPQRDIDRVLAVVDDHDARVSHVLETHIHNDYVTGGFVLAELLGVPYVVNADDEVAFDRLGVRDGDVLEAGAMNIRVVATPGHTYTHLAYAFEVDGEPPVLCSGGSLLYGSTGRPDLLGMEHAHDLASHQWESARRLVDELPGDTALLPTHGFGSFCAATETSGADQSTLHHEALGNPVLGQDRETFIDEVIAGLDDYPAYYAHMAPANSAGPDPADLSPPALADADELRRRMDAGEWVVDLRSRTAFAPRHVPGTLNFGIDEESFVTWLGWLIPWGTPLTLLGSTADDVAAAQRELVRIGIDRPAAAAVGDPESWTDGSLAERQSVDFAGLAAAMSQDPDGFVVLDVRRDSERADSHIPGSLHIPLHELIDRMHEVPDGQTAWVHCAAGYRASIAASLLARGGIEVVSVDDDYDVATSMGLTNHATAATPA
ncbi:MAG TPA: MBL fold metallo-hydrolase [Nitriliruptoraceae bacterium]|nr:MBL fold metallo-hydrolase [Nitriliruptoraceae bacterium]